MRFNVNDLYKFNSTLLVVGVILGIIVGFMSSSTIPVVLIPILTQIKWLSDLVKRIVYKEETQALIRLTDSAVLYNPPDNYSVGRYGRAVNYKLDRYAYNGYYLLRIESNGIKNTKKINELAADVSAAFKHPAYLMELGNGYAIYRIDIKKANQHVSEDEF